jgi:rhamnulokinase
MPYAYRDPRTDPVIETVRDAVGEHVLYALTGIQHLPFNTLFQLAAEPDLSRARSMLLIPDLVGYWLTGSVGAETTNASTTQLYDGRRRTWAYDIATLAGIPHRLLPPLREPGTIIGELLPQVAPRAGQRPGTPVVVAVASHDTASAVVGSPRRPGRQRPTSPPAPGPSSASSSTGPS